MWPFAHVIQFRRNIFRNSYRFGVFIVLHIFSGNSAFSSQFKRLQDTCPLQLFCPLQLLRRVQPPGGVAPPTCHAVHPPTFGPHGLCPLGRIARTRTRACAHTDHTRRSTLADAGCQVPGPPSIRSSTSRPECAIRDRARNRGDVCFVRSPCWRSRGTRLQHLHLLRPRRHKHLLRRY